MKQDPAGYKKAAGTAWIRYSNTVNKASILFKKQMEQAWQIFMDEKHLISERRPEK